MKPVPLSTFIWPLSALAARRDIAILGVIHRTVLGKGLGQFSDFFKRPQHSNTLHDPRNGTKSPLIKRSALGLAAIYNLLPPGIRAAKSVAVLQKQLQACINRFAASGFPQWSEVLSPRIPLASHPLALHAIVASDG